MRFEFQQTPVSKEEVAAVENIFGHSIPQELKKIVLSHNGAAVTGKRKEIESLISFSKNDVVNIYKVLEIFNNRKKNKLFPFGVDCGGNFYCLNYLEHDSIPTVIILDHETFSSLLLADSFQEFWESIN